MTVAKDEREQDPARRYKMAYYYGGGVGMAWSPDGLRWTAHQPNPVIAPTGDASQSLFWDERYGLYVMYLRPNGHHKKRTWRNRGVPYDASVFPTRRMGRAESIDAASWTHIEEVLTPDQRDGPGTEFYYMPVLPYQGAYLGFLNVYHEFTGDSQPLAGTNYTIDAQLTFSRDAPVDAGLRPPSLPPPATSKPGTKSACTSTRPSRGRMHPHLLSRLEYPARRHQRFIRHATQRSAFARRCLRYRRVASRWLCLYCCGRSAGKSDDPATAL